MDDSLEVSMLDGIADFNKELIFLELGILGILMIMLDILIQTGCVTVHERIEQLMVNSH